MKLIYLPLLAALYAPFCYAVNDSASINIDENQSVGRIQGRSGVVQLSGDKVELLNRVVYVNGVSYGKVPEIANIKFIVTKTGKTLYVDDKPRRPAGKP